MRLKIIGKLWGFRFVRSIDGGKSDGECDNPSVKNKEIRIHSAAKGQQLLETLIHEMSHAGDWHKSEEWVTEFSQDAARALWRLGYRRNGEL